MTTSDGSQSKPRNRKCGNCRFYEPAPLWRKGWCRNPKLYPPHANHLVDSTTIDCEGGFRSRIYWEPITAGQGQDARRMPLYPTNQPDEQQPTAPVAATGNYAAPPPRNTPPAAPVYRQTPPISNLDYQNQPPVAPAQEQDTGRTPLVNRFRRSQQEIEDIEARARAEADTELRRLDYSNPPNVGPVANASSYTPPAEQPTMPFSTNEYRTRPEPETRPFPTVAPSSYNAYQQPPTEASAPIPPAQTGPNPAPASNYQPPVVERPRYGSYQPPIVEPPAQNNWSSVDPEAVTEVYNNYGGNRPTEPARYGYQGQPSQEQITEAQYKFIDSQPTEQSQRPPKVIVRPERGGPAQGRVPLEPIRQPGNPQQPKQPSKPAINVDDLLNRAKQTWASLPPVRMGSRVFSGQQVVLAGVAAFLLIVVLFMVLNGGNKNTPVAGTLTPTVGSVARATTTGGLSTTSSAIVSTTVAVTTVAPTTAPATTAPAEKTALVSGNGETPLNVRDTPAIKGKIVTTIKEGEKVTILAGPQEADGRVWYKVDYKGTVGWAVRDYLKL